MLENAFTLGGYLLCLLMASVAVICWRKAQSFYALLLESSNQIDALKDELKNVDRDRTKAIEKLQQLKDQSQRVEKQLNHQSTKLEQDYKVIESRALAAEESVAGLTLKYEHYRSQAEVLTRQLRESDDELKEVQTKLSYVHGKHQEQVDKLKSQWNAEQQMLQKRLFEHQKSEASSRKAASMVDAAELNDAKRKAAHFESLYRAMRGQREMAEERNRNWEVALRKLSQWIITRQGGVREKASENLGPLVGQALEVVGAQLIDDEFSSKPETRS